VQSPLKTILKKVLRNTEMSETGLQLNWESKPPRLQLKPTKPKLAIIVITEMADVRACAFKWLYRYASIHVNGAVGRIYFRYKQETQFNPHKRNTS